MNINNFNKDNFYDLTNLNVDELKSLENQTGNTAIVECSKKDFALGYNTERNKWMLYFIKEQVDLKKLIKL